MDVKICEIGSMPEWHIINDKMTYDKLTFILILIYVILA